MVGFAPVIGHAALRSLETPFGTYGGELDYKRFVDFVLAIELLPRCPRPSFFFDIFDVNDDAQLDTTEWDYGRSTWFDDLESDPGKLSERRKQP